MIRAKYWLRVVGLSCLVTALNTLGKVAPAYSVSFVNSLTLPGNATDLSGEGNGVNFNRLGYFSDLYYDRTNNVYYALSDRGPGGGLLNYDTRVQKFTLDVNPNTGAISNFNLVQTILFTQNGQNFNGLNPLLLNGNSSTLGLSQDPEGFALAPNGNFYVSDEYGPSVYEFNPQGQFIRAFEVPKNILPLQDNTPNFVDGRPTITTGRQDNRGYEGLAITPDGSKLLAILQDPLVNEGATDGRFSRNLRIVEFDTATGKSTAQYIYQLEPLADINDRIPGTADDFAASAQGRNIGVSSIVALNNTQFLVLERDNRGLGVDDPLAQNPVGSKRVYTIDITGATDVSNISLAGLNELPVGVVPVQKNSANPLIDIAALLKAGGQVIPEKLEGLAIGPQLADGSYALLIGTDNDFSVTQTGSGEQFNVCVGSGSSTQVPVNSSCPTGQNLIPSFLSSFKVSASELGNYQPSQAVPEPTSILGAIAASLGGLWLKRRQKSA